MSAPLFNVLCIAFGMAWVWGLIGYGIIPIPNWRKRVLILEHPEKGSLESVAKSTNKTPMEVLQKAITTYKFIAEECRRGGEFYLDGDYVDFDFEAPKPNHLKVIEGGKP